MNEYEQATQELLSAVRLMLNSHKCYCDVTHTGLITSVNDDGSYGVRVNGKIFTLPLYIKRTLQENDVVKVMFPKNNSNEAFIL